MAPKTIGTRIIQTLTMVQTRDHIIDFRITWVFSKIFLEILRFSSNSDFKSSDIVLESRI